MIQRRDVFMDAELEGVTVGMLKSAPSKVASKAAAGDYDKIGQEVWQLTKERR
jgi:hypothetical protein